MKFYDLVEMLQEEDKGYIVLINAGGFYIAVGKDAVLLNKILDLKLSCMCKNVCKVGFPKTAIDKYEKLIKRNKYSYVVYNYDREKNKLEILNKYTGKLENTSKDKKRDCYICKSQLDGYTNKEDRFIKSIADLRKRERDERKQINIDT